MPVDKFGRMSDTKTKDTGVLLTYINNNYIRSDGGTPVSGSINMNGNTLYNVSNPVNPQDVATKEYADKVGGGSPFFKENGNYQASHAINMAYNKLLNLHKPTEPYDAATKDYVDYYVKINLKKHMIVAIASYHGDLIKGDYQFTFGGSSKHPYNKYHNMYNGFLMPQSGYIKRFVVDDLGFKYCSKGYDDVNDFIKEKIGLNTPIPLFTLVLIKDVYFKREIVDLVTINLILSNENGADLQRPIYSFTSNLKGELNEYKINMRDISNIRSEFAVKSNEFDKVFTISRRGYGISDVVKMLFRVLYLPCYHLDKSWIRCRYISFLEE